MATTITPHHVTVPRAELPQGSFPPRLIKVNPSTANLSPWGEKLTKRPRAVYDVSYECFPKLKKHHGCYSEQAQASSVAITWPSRSPDLTQLNLFLWSYKKDIVNQASVYMIPFKMVIPETAVLIITPEMLKKQIVQTGYSP
ncbi:hypothetical protein CEXT_427241 [Caerostris extrusa]|uniref:Uncharacterized protein n=1 Tax=Caerostris extrusa TaxID=172846 RepID=A0AAV4W3L1_CAEEX|nr:hypothetical protein CEXT_427241 [Caerostris extrusa]